MTALIFSNTCTSIIFQAVNLAPQGDNLMNATAVNNADMTKTDIPVAFSDRLRSIMQARGVRQVDIVNEVGVSKSAVSKWVAGTAVPNFNYGELLAKLLGVSYDYLISGDDSANSLPFVTFETKDLLSETESLPERITTAMNHNNIHKLQLHRLMSSTQHAVNGWLDGKTKPNKKTLERLASVLNVSFKWLAYGEGTPQNLTAPSIPILDNKRDLKTKNPMEIASRLKEVMYKLDLQAIDIVDGLGEKATRGMVSRWLSGHIAPSHDNLHKLSVLLGVPFEWLAYGSVETEATPHSSVDIKPNAAREPELALEDKFAYKSHADLSIKPDIRFCAQPADDDEYEAGYFKPINHSNADIIAAIKTNKDLPVIAKTPFTVKVRRTVAERCNASVGDSFCYRHESRAMYPRITYNALCIADRSKTEIKEGKIYVFRHGFVLRTRYLQRMPDGGLLILSCNNDCSDEIVPASELSTIEILGWVYCMMNYDQD